MSSLSLSCLQSRTFDRLDAASRRVFFRADLNVPMRNGAVADSTRISRSSQGIKELAERGARVVVASHFGRPGGERVDGMSLAPVAPALEQAIGRPVSFVDDCVGPVAEGAVAAMGDGDIVLLENLRFHPGEEQCGADFAAALSRLADAFVNDAFSCSHRGHASIEAVARLLPAYAGPLMAEELAALRDVLEEPEPPMLALVGGSKISSKLGVLRNLVEKVDGLIVGGGMANTFLMALGEEIGGSLVETDMLEEAGSVMKKAEASGCRLLLPRDVVVSKAPAAGAESRVASIGDGGIGADEMILDAGPETVALAVEAIDSARSLVWNGPMGVFEMPPFDAATTALARHAAARTRDAGLVSVAGGGETAAALNAAGAGDGFRYVSTAGGAFLEWLEGKTLPGVAALLA